MGDVDGADAVLELRRLAAIDAKRFARKAMRMHEELERGVADESFDRLELMRGQARAAHYAWALVAVLRYAELDEEVLTPRGSWHGPVAPRLAHVAGQVLREGEPDDAMLLVVDGVDD